MHFRRGMNGSGGSGRIKLNSNLSEGMPTSSLQRSVPEEQRSSGNADVYQQASSYHSAEIYHSSNQAHHALHTAGIHLDNALATLQILSLPGADRRAILVDVARSLARSEKELKHAYQGSICGDAHGHTATYDYHQIQGQLVDLRRELMRQMHELSPCDRIPIMSILNPPFEML